MLLSINKLAGRWSCVATFLVALCAYSLPPVNAANNAASYRAGYVDQGQGIPRVHAASLIEADNRLFATWYAGTREGAKDVAIYFSSYDESKARWSEDRKLFDRESVQKSLGRYIKKLGNPVLGVDNKGKLWIYFVSVSAGGWSGSAINYSFSTNLGESWAPPKRLVTSPFFNVSTLVRMPPINLVDGNIGLPVYHELLGKFGELLRITPDGKVVAKHRISWGTSTLQPSLVSLNDMTMLVFLRNAGHTLPGVLFSRSENNGETWGAVKTTGLPSFDSSVAAILDRKNRLLLVFNNTTTNRNILSLAVSEDGGTSWRVIHDFEKSKQIHDEFSYPSLLQDRQGNYHLAYTWLRKRIRHIRFNESWLDSKMKQEIKP